MAAYLAARGDKARKKARARVDAIHAMFWREKLRRVGVAQR